WAIPGSLAQFADLIDAPVGGSINFNDIDRISPPDLRTRFAYSARLGHRLVRRPAVERHGQNARHGGLPDTPVSAKDISVSRAPLLNGVLQGLGDVLLPYDLGELLRTVLAGQNLIAHESEAKLYVMAKGIASFRFVLLSAAKALCILLDEPIC